MKTVVVTGATSMVGVATIEQFLNDDYKIIAIARRNSKNLSRLPKSSNLEVIEANIDEFEKVMPNTNADIFYHFAWGATSHSGRENVFAQQENILYTLEAVKLAKKFGALKFIFAGSQAEYGLSDKPLNKDTLINPITPYGVAKFASGKMAKILCDELNLKFVCVRILSVYGKNDRPNTLINYIVNCYKKNTRPILTKCEQIWDYLYSDDAGCALKLLGETSACGVYTLGSGKAMPLKNYVEIIYKLMNPTVPLIFGEKEYGKNQVMTLQADISDLERDTGFRPLVSFEEGISKILESLY